MKLLLCDRHWVFAESLAVVLGEAGYDVVAITRGLDDTLAVLGREPVDICVLDLGVMPGDELDRLAALRAVAPGMQIVLVSERADADKVTAAAARGVRGFVSKDQHVADITDTIERVHAGATVLPVPARAGSRGGSASSDVARRSAALLTPREREALGHLVLGEDTKGVARAMGVTYATARSHIQTALTKLGVHSRVEAAATALRLGLINAETGEWLVG